MLFNWNFMRLLRAGLAAWAIWQAFATGELIFLLPGGILGLQAIFNVGCCGSAGCYGPPASRQTEGGNDVVAYEEVK